MRKKWIFLAGLLVCLIAAAWLFYNYQQPRAGVASVKANYTLTASNLYQEFAANEKKANEKYNGKVITVKGPVMEIIKDDAQLLIVLKAGESGGGVSCSFTNSLPQKIPIQGEEVSIKGQCTGFLLDVNLVDAVMIP